MIFPLVPVIMAPPSPSPIGSSAPSSSGLSGRKPPSIQYRATSGFPGFPGNFIFTEEETGQLSGCQAAVHIFSYVLLTLHSTSEGYPNPTVLNGGSIRWQPM